MSFLVIKRGPLVEKGWLRTSVPDDALNSRVWCCRKLQSSLRVKISSLSKTNFVGTSIHWSSDVDEDDDLVFFFNEKKSILEHKTKILDDHFQM